PAAKRVRSWCSHASQPPQRCCSSPRRRVPGRPDSSAPTGASSIGQQRHLQRLTPAELYGAGERRVAELVLYGVDDRIDVASLHTLERQLQLQRIGAEAGDRHTEQRDALAIDHRAGAAQQRTSRVEHDIGAVGRRWERVRPGGARVVVEAQAQGHGSRGTTALAQPAADPVDERNQHRVEIVSRRLGPAEAVLRTDRTASPTGLDTTRVAPVRKRMQMPGRPLPDDRGKPRLLELRELAYGPDTVRSQARRGHRADTPEAFDRQWVQERE